MNETGNNPFSNLNLGNFLGGAGNLYGSYLGAQNQNGLSNAANAGYGMAQGAYNPTNFGYGGVGGTGFSMSSPNGGPGSISTSLGAFNPMYGNYAGAAGGYLGQSQGLANTASSGATGAYQSALSSIMPQLQQMQGNLLASNNNGLFQRGQLGSGSFGQNTAGGPNNPVNLTTQSLGSGFAQQDLNAITAAQNQGLNFFNSNLQGASALGGLGTNATNTGLGMINAQNATGSLPLAYSQLYGNQQIGATNANANTIRASNYQGNAFGSGTGSLLQGLGSGLSGIFGGNAGGTSGGGVGNSVQQLYNSIFGGGGSNMGGGLTGNPANYSGLTDTSGTPYFLSNDPSMSYAGGATDASGVGDMSSATSGLGQGSTLQDMVNGFSPASGGAADAAASAGSSALGDAAGAGAAPAAYAAYNALTAAPGAIDTMALAQTGSASLNGVMGSLGATTDTSAGAAGAADAGLGAGLGAAALAGGGFVGGAMLLADYFGSKPPDNAGWDNAIPGGPGWNARAGGIQNDGINYSAAA